MRIEAYEDAREDGGRRLTGWHVLAWLIGFFAVVFVANTFLVRLASSTFSGTVSDNAYREGLAYNSELEAGRRQDALGWRVTASVNRAADGTGSVLVEARDGSGTPLTGLQGHALLARPTDKREDRSGDLVSQGGGTYRLEVPSLALGVWDLTVELDKDGQRQFMSLNRVILR